MDLSRVKIAFIAGCLGQGGAERQLFYIVRTLTEVGASVRVLSLTQGEYWEHRIRELGVPIIWVGQQQSRLTRVWRILRELRAERPDIIQSQHFFCNFYAAIAGRFLGIAEIGAIRSNVHYEMESNGRLMGKLLLRLPRLLAANSRPAIELARYWAVATDRLCYLPNAVDSERFQPRPREPNGVIHALAVGSLLKLKRYDLFLDAIAAIRSEHRLPIRARIVGDGPERKNLERHAVERGLAPEFLEFAGLSASMNDHYSWADMLVLSSDCEGTPNVILEAMASGLPVVATAAGGVPELVDHGVTGFVVPCGDSVCLTEAIRRLCENPETRCAFGASGRKQVLERHSCSVLRDRLSELYRKVLP